MTDKAAGGLPHPVTDVRGWMDPPELVLLNALARSAPPGPILEVGSYEGLSTLALLQTGRPVTCVDTWKGSPSEGEVRDHYPDFCSNLIRHGYAGMAEGTAYW